MASTMTRDDESHTPGDQNALETTPRAITHVNLGKSHGIDETLTECTNSLAEEEIPCKEMLAQQHPALAQSVTINNGNDEGKHCEPALTTQTTSSANADSSVGEEQSHRKCALPRTQEDVSSKQTRAKPRLVSDSTVVSDNLPTKPVAARISDDDLMNVLEHCFDKVDFASISLNENSEGYNEDDVKTLKKIFGSNADDSNNHITKKGSNDRNIMNKTSNQKYFKSHHLRKRRFFKHLIQNNTIRVRLERMLQNSASADLFISKTKQKRKRNTQQQSSKHVAASTAATATATIPFDDRSVAKEVLEGHFQSHSNEDGKAGASDKNDRRSDDSNITNENDTNGDKSDLTHLKKTNDREELRNTPHTSNDSEMEIHPFSDRIQDKNAITSNQEGSSCPPLGENGVSESPFHVDDLKIKEEGKSDGRTLNTEPMPAVSCIKEKGYSRRRKNSPVDDEISNERRNDGPVDLDAMYDQEEFASLLSSHQDPHERNDIHPERTKCSMKEQANTTIEKYTDARQLWAARAVGNESDSDCSERNGDEIDSKPSSTGSFESASPFFFGATEEKGPKTKLTSVTMEDDSMKTCYSSREVSLGGPVSSEEEGLNLLESSISRIVKKNGEKSREQRIRFTCMVVILLLVTIGIFALGVFLGLTSHSKWNSYQQKNEVEPPQ